MANKEGSLVWGGDLPDGSHVEFRMLEGKLIRYYRVYNARTGRPEFDLVKDEKFSESTNSELFQILTKLTEVEARLSASLWNE